MTAHHLHLIDNAR